jgi:uncharacterized membrane protein YfcA
VDATGWALLAGGGFLAGVVNTLAGGGSLLTVPLMVSLGLPPTLANGTNRVGVLASSIASAWRFRRDGVSGLHGARRVVVPVLLGSVAGATLVAQLDNDHFQALFAVVMVALLVPTLRRPRVLRPRDESTPAWSRARTFAVFLAIGLYGGALQAGVGIFLIYALTHAGYDLVRANSIKVVVVAAFTSVALPIFVLEGQVDWLWGAVLALGFALGGLVGASVTVAGGDHLVRPMLALAVVALAGRMLGFY